MHYLCLDYGTKRIGVALATTPIAEPLEIIQNHIKSQADIVTEGALERLQELIKLHSVDTIIVGISEERMARQTREFIEVLEKVIALPIQEADETLSTYQTFAQMKTMKKSKREGDRDHFAAANILQNYLDLEGALTL